MGGGELGRRSWSSETLTEKEVLTTTLDAEVLVSGVRAGGHGVGARQKFMKRWNKTLGVSTRLLLAFEHWSVDTHTEHPIKQCLMHMVAFFRIFLPMRTPKRRGQVSPDMVAFFCKCEPMETARSLGDDKHTAVVRRK